METRLVPRIAVQLKLLVELDEKPGQSIGFANGKYFEASAIDISEGGLCLIIKKYYLPQGTNIELALMGEPFGLKKEMKLKGEVRFCKNYKSGTYKCGVKIIDITEENVKVIKSFIAKYDKRQKPRFSLPE